MTEATTDNMPRTWTEGPILGATPVTVGRTVHYRDPNLDVCWAAIVTAVHADARVSLCVILPTGLRFMSGVPRANVIPDPSQGTWHWPERV